MSQPSSYPPHESTKRISLWAVLAFAGVVTILVLIGIRLFQSDASPVTAGQKPRDFSLLTYSGEEINTADLRGKVVLINFWASWCATCDEEAALLEQAWQVYRVDDADQVVFLGVAYMDAAPASQAFLADYGISYPNGPDLRGAISKIYQVNSVPETFILDADGVLRNIKIGTFLSIGEIQSAVDEVLRQPVE